jgi:hypothetical protein
VTQGFTKNKGPSAVINDTNITGVIANQNLTLGWAGTLAGPRLNSNVVQNLVPDTNISGTITSQTLTLQWLGQLGISRGGTALSSVGPSGSILTSTGTTLGYYPAPLPLNEGGTGYSSLTFPVQVLDDFTATAIDSRWIQTLVGSGAAITLSSTNPGTVTLTAGSGVGGHVTLFWNSTSTLQIDTSKNFMFEVNWKWSAGTSTWFDAGIGNADNANHYVFVRWIPSTGYYTLTVSDIGGVSQIYNTAVSPTLGNYDKIRVTYLNSLLTMTINGTVVVSATITLPSVSLSPLLRNIATDNLSSMVDYFVVQQTKT